MRPTLFGVKSLLFFAAITGAFFAAPYVNLYFMLLAFFGAHWVLAVWWTAGNLRGLEVHVEAPQPVPSGAASSVRWTVLGDRPRFELTLRLDLEGGQHAEGELLFTGDQPSGRLVLPALERGVHRVRAATVRSSYPFDLLRRVVRLEAGPTIHVYPAPAEGALATRGLDVSSEEPEKGAGGAVGRTQPAGLRPRLWPAKGERRVARQQRLRQRGAARGGGAAARVVARIGAVRLGSPADEPRDVQHLLQQLHATSCTRHVARCTSHAARLTVQVQVQAQVQVRSVEALEVA